MKIALPLAALAVAAAVTPAHATPVGPVCRQVTADGSNVVAVCVGTDLHESGLTVAPTFTVGCQIGPRPTPLCYAIGLEGLGTTGFVPNPAFPMPAVDPATGSVHVFAGTVGSIWVNGTEYPVQTKDVCIGDTSYC